MKLQLEQINNYEDAVSYIIQIPRFSGKNTFEITKQFYCFMGEPGQKANIIHVAGTNGKGSVCAYLLSFLTQMNFKTGMFTSPHLVSINERINIDASQISKEAFYQSFCTVRDWLNQFRQQREENRSYHPSFFEYLFFLAMVYFEKEQTEYIILETGLGGRLDATNVIGHAVACIITEIGYDHMEYLGDTLSEIATEKAGIILKDTPVICWDKREDISSVIESRARQLNAPCFFVSKENGNLISIHDKKIDFSYKSRYYEYVRLICPSSAVYQVDNALLALTAMEHIFPREVLSEELLSKGIANMHWEGRMEEILPNVFVDGAHNEDGMKAFLNSLPKQSKGKRRLLFSAVSDKQVEKMAELIIQSGLFESIMVAPIENKRGLKKEQLVTIFSDFPGLLYKDTPEEAFETLLKEQGTKDTIYIIGSLYLIGQIKEWRLNHD